MNWNEAARIDWGTVILFGCGIALGTLLSDTGLAEIIGNGIADAFGFTSLLAVSAVSALIAIVISETTSNTASATIVVPIVIPIAAAAGLDPLVPALAAVFGASFGFMMPVSTPAERRRLRLGHDPDNQDGPLGHSLRHHRPHPYSPPDPDDGRDFPGGVMPDPETTGAAGNI